MKKYLFITILTCMMLFLFGCEKKDDSKLESYLTEEKGYMDLMMENMDNVEDTGNASLDFLYGMIPHHEAAIDMSRSYLKHAGDKARFSEMANDIISAQDQEIDQMNDMIKRIEKSGQTDFDQEQDYLEKYNKMMLEHHEGHSDTNAGDLDTAFAMGMSMHHQMAIDMAEAIVYNTEDEEVVEFARNIISLQKQEMEEMQKYLDGEEHAH